MQEITGPRQVILVTSRAETEIMGKKQEKDNIFALSWHMPLSFEPELYAISAGKKRFSTKLIKQSGVFCVNFMPYSFEKEVLFCGRNSGEHIDKFKESGLEKESCEKIDCARIKQASAFLECEVADEIEAGDHIIFVGRVVKSALLNDKKRVFQLSGNQFTTTIN